MFSAGTCVGPCYVNCITYSRINSMYIREEASLNSMESTLYAIVVYKCSSVLWSNYIRSNYIRIVFFLVGMYVLSYTIA